jgi:3-oxoacyl-[acyl-carrier protein] reductase
MTTPLVDRIALVTGSTQGIGRDIAAELLASGARVVVSSHDGDHANTVAQELDPTGNRTLALRLDVRERADFEAAVTAIVAKWDRIDILVNNAGITVSQDFFDITDDDWDAVQTTNLRSVFIGCQVVAPVMRANGFGRIINHASLAGQQGGAVAGPHYAAAKAGIIVLTKILAGTLARDGITVNAIAPAAIAGPVMETLPASRLQELAANIPVGRFGTGAEVAALVSYLCSDRAAFITGTTVDINGGLHMR